MAEDDFPSEGDDLWETHAGWWQDGFSEGADPEYEEQILPLAARYLAGATDVLDVGCGEGQVARLAVRGGAQRVVGIDPTWAQVDVAAQRGGGAVYARAGAAGLPFADGSFDAAIACLVFEHITDVDEAIAEVARVLRPGGRFAFFLNHPLLQTPNLIHNHVHLRGSQVHRHHTAVRVHEQGDGQGQVVIEAEGGLQQQLDQRARSAVGAASR